MQDLSPAQRSSPFRTFWMGGYEGADHVNGEGQALDVVDASGHADHLEADHRRACELGIATVRESIGWRLAEPRPGRFDFSRLHRVARSARACRMQVLWSLMHYGTPLDVDLLDDAVCDRFVRFAVAVATEIASISDAAPVYNLVNEPSFLAWAVSATNLVFPYRGEDRCGPGLDGTAQSASAVGYALKRRLVRMSLLAMDAIREIDPRARFLHVDPLVHVAPPLDRPELAGQAAQVEAYQWQAWDMVAGRCEPELGGSPAALDIVGANVYHANQWEFETGRRLEWHLRDPRRLPARLLLRRAWERYRRPLIVAETSHFGDGRADWLHEMAAEVECARRDGVPVDGVCLYPLVDRPDWGDARHWHHSGMWDVVPAPAAATPSCGGPVEPQAPSSHAAPALERVPCRPYHAALQAWQRRLPHPPVPGVPMKTLIVFSHLRWGFVYQRPQHLMSRLAKTYRVLFVEEPVRSDAAPRLEVSVKGPNLEVLVAHTPLPESGFSDAQIDVVRPLLARKLHDDGVDDCLVWFYTPLALPLLDGLSPSAVVYDCMDELAAFDHAPRGLVEREDELFRRADIVFTGGPSLYEAKRHRHPDVHCLPSSVDAAHFAPASLVHGSACATEAHALQAGIARPRLGYFGVIDERLDLALVAALADAHAEWQIVMAGPVVKIDPATLPRRPNIHWLGMQTYERLPYLLAEWDLCLMPFALNAATRFISPTKTLEYMAGDKPVVSTPVVDVIALYGDAVRIGGAQDFVTQCEQALAETSAQREERRIAMRALLAASSWDQAADRVSKALDRVLAGRATPVETAA